MKNRLGKLSSAWIQKLLLISQALIVANIVFPSVAFAYIDPGSGSVIVTTILGLVAAVGYTVRKYFYKIKRLFTGAEEDSEQDDQDKINNEHSG
jgi:uncharacterized membrane protein